MPWHYLFGSDCGGTVLRQRRDKETTKKDKRIEERNYGAWMFPPSALARVLCSHTKEVPFPLASKDGEIGRYIFFESQNKQLCGQIVPRMALHGRVRTSRNLGE